jgi:hypothetical protein
MNPPNGQNKNETKRTRGEAVARRFLRKYATRSFADRGPLYCGYLGSHTELDIRLWKHVESQLTDEEEQLLLDHTDNCLYCQSRIRDIAKAMRQSVRKPDLMLKLAKATNRVRDETGEFLAELLIAVENTGRWLHGSLDCGLLLRPIPATRGLGTIPTKGVPSTARPEAQSVKSLTPAFRVSTIIEGGTLSCEIRRSGSNLALSVGCVGGKATDSGSLPTITCSVDGTTVQPASLRSDETPFIAPLDSKKIEFTVYQRENEIGYMVVEME